MNEGLSIGPETLQLPCIFLTCADCYQSHLAHASHTSSPPCLPLQKHGLACWSFESLSTEQEALRLRNVTEAQCAESPRTQRVYRQVRPRHLMAPSDMITLRQPTRVLIV